MLKKQTSGIWFSRAHIFVSLCFFTPLQTVSSRNWRFCF